jgi:hypothetical protein
VVPECPEEHDNDARRAVVSVPELEDWMTATDVAARLKLTRQSINKKIHGGEFGKDNVRRLGSQYVIATAAVEAMEAARAQAEDDKTPPKS